MPSLFVDPTGYLTQFPTKLLMNVKIESRFSGTPNNYVPTKKIYRADGSIYFIPE